MSLQTRMPSLWALLVGPDAEAEDRLKAAIIRASALKELQEAQKRRDTRRVHKAHQEAVKATCEALKAGA